MKKENMSKLYSYLENNKPNIYPIGNKYLNYADEDFKIYYFKMLALLLQQNSEISENQKQLYKRLAVGVKNNVKILDFIEMQWDFKIEEFVNFIKQCKTSDLKYRFIFDGLILVCMEEKVHDQIKLLAYFCDELGIKKEELSYLAENAAAILEMSKAKFADAEINKSPLAVNLTNDIFAEYMEFAMKSFLFEGEKITLYCPVSNSETTIRDLSKAQSSLTPCVKIVGIKINLDEFGLGFKNREKVILENCVFTGGLNNSIIFENCEKVVIENCKFENFSTYAIKYKNVNSLEISHTQFLNCIRKYHSSDAHWTSEGQVILCMDEKISDGVILDNCVFDDCGGQNAYERTKSAFICNGRVKADKCRFIRCWNYRNCDKAAREKDPEDRRRTMFASGSLSVNCIFDDCALFC